MDFRLILDVSPTAAELWRSTLATAADFTARFDRIDLATSAIQSKIDDLRAKVATSGLTEAEEATVLAKLDAHGDALDAVIVDPVVPVTPTL